MRVELIALAALALLTGCGGAGLQINSLADLQDALATAPPQQSSAPAPAPQQTASGPSLQQMLNLHNSTRAAKGLQPLTLNSRLSAAAQAHIDYCAGSGKISHSGSGGSRVGMRVTATGYQWRAVAENLAFSTRPERIYDLWLSSPGHLANILDGRYTEVGIGKTAAGDGEYWCVVFGLPR